MTVSVSANFAGRQNRTILIVGSINSTFNINAKNTLTKTEFDEIPTEDELERILRSIGGEAKVDVFIRAVEDTFEREGRKLKHDWFELTSKTFQK